MNKVNYSDVGSKSSKKAASKTRKIPVGTSGAFTEVSVSKEAVLANDEAVTKALETLHIDAPHKPELSKFTVYFNGFNGFHRDRSRKRVEDALHLGAVILEKIAYEKKKEFKNYKAKVYEDAYQILYTLSESLGLEFSQILI